MYVLVATGYAISGLVSPQSILPAGMVATEIALVFAMYYGLLFEEHHP
jgi:hypothetical protein